MPPMLTARTATEADADALLAWRNDPETRRWSRTTDPVAAADHRAWLRRTLDSDRRVLLVGEDEAGPAGTVRWDLEDDGTWEVSITVAPGRRGQGLAGPLLAAGERALRERTQLPATVHAVIHRDNDASNRLFSRAGYLVSGPPDDDGFALWSENLS